MDVATELAKIKAFLKEAEFLKAYELVRKLEPGEIPLGHDFKRKGLKEVEQALNLRSVAAELSDYASDYVRASQFAEEASGYSLARLEHLRKTGSVAEDSFDILLQDVWLCLQGGLSRYRSGNYDAAEEIFKACENALNNAKVKDGPKPYFGARARCLYSIGLVYRERYDLRKAIEYFTRSAEMAYASLNRGGRTPLALVAIARVIGMGLAPAYNTLGRTDVALPMTLSAKAMLPASERMISVHIDLIRAILPPWRSEEEYDEAERVAALEACHVFFGSLPYPHYAYQARAAYFLALKHLELAGRARGSGVKRPPEVDLHLREAEQLIAEIEKTPSGDARFHLMIFVLKSGVALAKGRAGEAESLASTGLQLTPDRHLAVRLDLLMARARARSERKDFERAAGDLKSGLALAEAANNKRVYAQFLLRLSVVHSRAGKVREAMACLNDFKSMADQREVSGRDVQALAELARQEVGKDLIIGYSEEIEPDEAEVRLHQFLAERVRQQADSDVDAARRLGVSRTTYYNWLKGKGNKKNLDAR